MIQSLLVLRTLIALALLLPASLIFGQSFSLSGKVLDETAQELPSAWVALYDSTESQIEASTISNEKGDFFWEKLPGGTYILRITYLGFQDYQQLISLQENMQLEPIRLSPQSLELKEVEVTESPNPVSISEDTTQFDARAFKTLPDASAEDLVNKMPTITRENGQVSAEGEQVRQVLVDGKPFFGNDPLAALRNLPAEVIEKIQVFDQQSDQATFTGFEDGNTTKTINIITRSDSRQGEFGKIYAGYGTEERYQIGGNLNFFNGDQRLSLVGMSNNINQQNFSAEDLLGVVGTQGRRGRGGRGGGRGGGRSEGGSTDNFTVSPSGGISRTHALGLNFNDEWGEAIKLNASYFFNQSRNTADQLTTQLFLTDEAVSASYLERNETTSENINHRFNARLSFQIDTLNTLLWSPSLIWQGNEGFEELSGNQLSGSQVLNQTLNRFDSDLGSLRLQNNLLWRHKFRKARQTLSLHTRMGVQPTDADHQLSAINLLGTAIVDTQRLNQQAGLDQNNWNGSANAVYTHPLGKEGILMLNYRLSYQEEEREQLTRDFDEQTQVFDDLNPTLSNTFSNDYLTHRMGAGYRLKTGNWHLMARAELQAASLNNKQEFPFQQEIDQRFLNWLPMAMARFRPGRGENLRIFYRSSTDLPTIEQLQNVIDNSNPLQLFTGNPNLKQSVQHRLVGRYSRVMPRRGSLLVGLVSLSTTRDYIAQSIWLPGSRTPLPDSLDLPTDAQFSRPENLDGYWNLRGLFTYGFPCKAIRSNINIDLSLLYVREPGRIDNRLNFTRNWVPGLGLKISSNISQKVDFTLSTRTQLNLTSQTRERSSPERFLSQQTRLQFNTILGAGLVIRSDLSHQWWDGLEENPFDTSFWLWNMSVGKKIFKEERGEIAISVFDLLGQNNTINRTVTANFIEDVQTAVLQQYFMLNFRYDIRYWRTTKK